MTTEIQSLLLDAKAAATLCGLSRTAWYKQMSAGRIPRPVKIGSITRWRRDELMAWVRAGCPANWEWRTAKA